MAVGVGAPAFADTASADSASTVPTSINGGVVQVLNEQPLQKAADATQAAPMLSTLAQASDHLRGDTSADALVGQAALVAQGVAESGLVGAVPGALLLGGVPLSGVST
ncbi:hypothetical protein SAMN05216499_103354 [Actinacidiphila paucisporea]|uniref:Uncharacterized protein n=2 Tax=Actinacidiphila paucisporea TaxID=310782 RepID=A0A1M6ZJM8_9ACTN|nr:hypothetical protein SAMN05216499_103354 [Actinacidiphila paucisporea]